MALAGFEDILFQIKEKRTDMGDIEYLATQEFNENIIRLSSDISTLADTLTHTVTVGKDAYILIAKIVPSGFVQAAASPFGTNVQVIGNNSTEAKISSNGVELDRVTIGASTRTYAVNAPGNADSAGTGGSGYGTLTDGQFHAAIGAKAIAGQLVEIENTLDNGNCIAQMVILEVDAGTPPSI